jgi:hypothetical protein
MSLVTGNGSKIFREIVRQVADLIDAKHLVDIDARGQDAERRQDPSTAA